MEMIMIINNSPDAYEYYTYTGVLPQVKRRAATIKLTPEQIKEINIHNRERIESISMALTASG